MSNGNAAEALRVDPTGFAKSQNEVWVNGVWQEVVTERRDIDQLLVAAETAGALILKDVSESFAA